MTVMEQQITDLMKEIHVQLDLELVKVKDSRFVQLMALEQYVMQPPVPHLKKFVMV